MTVDTDHNSSICLDSPVNRYGGKGNIAHLLVPHFARRKVWIEPFFGGGAVLFAVPKGLYEVEVVNDLSSGVVTFFRVLRDRPDDLLRVCELTPYAREEFVLCLKDDTADELEVARRFWVKSRQGFGARDQLSEGQWRTVGRSSLVNPANGAERSLLRFSAASHRVRGVVTENIDAVSFIDRVAGSQSFVYSDPPYTIGVRNGATAYCHEMDDAHHERLAAAHRGAVARGAAVAVSGYESELYDKLYAGWRKLKFDVAAHIASYHAVESRRTEVLYCSYPASEELGRLVLATRAAVASKARSRRLK